MRGKRFAGARLTDDGHDLAFLDRKRYIADNGLAADSDAEMVDGKEGHGSGPSNESGMGAGRARNIFSRVKRIADGFADEQPKRKQQREGEESDEREPRRLWVVFALRQ